jgi:hypothetical protein
MSVKSILSFAALAAIGLAGSASAATNLVTNGGFETTVAPGPNVFLQPGTTAADWAYTGFASTIYASGTADTTGSNDGGVQIFLWGPGNNGGTGPHNGLTASSPNGGNFEAIDSDPVNVGQLTQTITGLTVGRNYDLTFYWAASQYEALNGTLYNGATFESWQATLGGITQSTPVVNIASHGFSGWMGASFDYTATSTSEVLSFFAVGPPGGIPPVALLDGVSLVMVPEPSTWALMVLGFGGLGFAAYRRARKNASALASV